MESKQTYTTKISFFSKIVRWCTLGLDNGHLVFSRQMCQDTFAHVHWTQRSVHHLTTDIRQNSEPKRTNHFNVVKVRAVESYCWSGV